MEENKIIQEYFEQEVSQKRTPPLPSKRKKTPLFDYAVTAACLLLVLGATLSPASYKGKFPINEITLKIEEAREMVPVIRSETSLYFLNKLPKGVIQ